MWIVRWFFIIFVVFFLVMFLSQNQHDEVQVRVMGWTSPQVPLSVALFAAGVAGYLMSLLVALINQLRLRSQISAARRKIKLLQNEVDHLRNIALEEDDLAITIAEKPQKAKGK